MTTAAANNLRYQSLPSQLIETPNGVVLKRGSLETEITGIGAFHAVRTVIEMAITPCTLEHIVAHFQLQDQTAIRALLRHLIDRSILVSVDSEVNQPIVSETPLDIFYWNFGRSTRDVVTALNEIQFLIIGINAISSRLVEAFLRSGVTSLTILDDPMLRNGTFFDTSGAMIPEKWPHNNLACVRDVSRDVGDSVAQAKAVIATSDCGALSPMRSWNRHCVTAQTHFFPVVLLDYVGYLGPLVIPTDTACFECLRARENANLLNADRDRQVQDATASAQSVLGFHPSLAVMLAELAVIELTAFYGNLHPFAKAGTLIELNVLAPRLACRKILKVPRCAVCSPLLSTPSLNLEIDPLYVGDAFAAGNGETS